MLRFLAVLLMLGGLAACDGDKNVPPSKSTFDRTPDQGILAVVNAIPDAPNLIVNYAGSRGTRQSRALAYGEGFAVATIISTYTMEIGYFDAAGQPQTVLSLQGADSIELREDDHFILVLTGSLADPEIVRIDNREYLYGVVFQNPADVTGDPEVHFAHFASGEAPLDFFLTASGTALADATPVASLAFGQSTAVQAVTAGTDFRLRITPQGDRTTVLHDSGTFPIPAATRRLHVAFEDFGPGGDRVRARFLASQMANYPADTRPSELRVAQLIADVPAVDVYLVDTDDPPIRAGLGVNTISPFAEAAPFSGNVIVTPAGVTTPVLFQGQIALASGTSHTLLLGGLRTDPSDATRSRVSAGLVSEDIRPLDGLIPVRAYHGSGTTGALNVHLLEPGQTFSDTTAQFPGLQLGSTSVRVFPPGERDLVITSGSPAAVVFGPERIELVPDNLYLLAIADTAGGGTPFGVELVATPLTRTP
ncbi:MAG: DUF4397 domain-containing protein [Pseudomonadales bacterium]|nr:DUF4397 domain-containing protein [Pseudomonadales bacterium]